MVNLTAPTDGGTVTTMPSRKLQGDRPVGVPQILRRFGWTNNQFEGYRRYSSATDAQADVPEPDWPWVGAGPAWWISTIDRWASYRAQWDERGIFTPVMSWAEACEPQPRKIAVKRPAKKRAPRR